MQWEQARGRDWDTQLERGSPMDPLSISLLSLPEVCSKKLGSCQKLRMS